MTTRVFHRLTLLDTIRARSARPPSSRTPAPPRGGGAHQHRLNGWSARSYSSIFSTLISTAEVDEAFRGEREPSAQARIILDYYR